ncbi:septal ring lytic transglycosylase RlpA family protein [Phormidium tenue FACHB-886]|nr:septal ring lytic transglycosylase RlpA family protein [Phormidium tenue FACHB-886]
MISVIDVPPVPSSQVHFAAAAPVSSETAALEGSTLLTQPSVWKSFVPKHLHLPEEVGTVVLQAVVQPPITLPQPVVSAISLQNPHTWLEAATPLRSNPKPLVKSILVWSAGASRALKPDLSLIAVREAQNPQSPEATSSAIVSSRTESAEPKDSEEKSEAKATEPSAESIEETSVAGVDVAAKATDSPLETPKNCIAAEEMLPKAAFSSMFQVQVKGKPIAYLPTQAAADTLSQQVEQLLQLPQFNPETLQPAIVNGVPVGKAADSILFEVTPDLAASYDHNPTLLAIAWINELRTALGAKPIALADAQSRMHNLMPTQKQLKGNASWYDPTLEGNITATGETFEMTDLTAAHPTLPFGTYLKVTNRETDDSIIVRVNDRGPYLEDRSLDVSGEAARCLNSEISGVVPFQAVIMESPQPQEAPSSL